MAKLYFRYGAMNSGKSTGLLQAAFNYEERGQRVLLAKPEVDVKGEGDVVSRLGVTRAVDFLVPAGADVRELFRRHATGDDPDALVKAFWNEAVEMMIGPDRLLRLFGVDGNGRMGWRNGKLEETVWVGTEGAEIENAQGSLIRDFLRRTGMVAANTLPGRDGGPTQWGAAHCHRIDYYLLDPELNAQVTAGLAGRTMATGNPAAVSTATASTPTAHPARPGMRPPSLKASNRSVVSEPLPPGASLTSLTIRATVDRGMKDCPKNGP